ncbi:DUF922 domain-containing protein [Pedobacter sp. AW1-32]|uniref:DUF922 domain-containing protein n=1 Tax=Pedobacter sp. AW1-32 TaxID=3383026 RepID=UPI003FF00C0E
MNKLFLLLFLAAAISFGFAINAPEQITWESHFKGKPDLRSPYFALTALSWQYSYESKVSRNRVEINLKNEISVDKNRSWVKWDKIKDPEIRASLLHHEQGHVNIHYIMFLEADRVLKNRSYSVKTYKADIKKLADEISDFFNTMQTNYDEETAHGSNHKMQARWDDIIEERMNESLQALADSK